MDCDCISAGVSRARQSFDTEIRPKGCFVNTLAGFAKESTFTRKYHIYRGEDLLFECTELTGWVIIVVVGTHSCMVTETGTWSSYQLHLLSLLSGTVIGSETVPVSAGLWYLLEDLSCLLAARISCRIWLHVVARSALVSPLRVQLLQWWFRKVCTVQRTVDIARVREFRTKSSVKVATIVHRNCSRLSMQQHVVIRHRSFCFQQQQCSIEIAPLVTQDHSAGPLRTSSGINLRTYHSRIFLHQRFI